MEAESEFRQFVHADLPDGTRQILCVVSRDDWFDQKTTFWDFARSAADDGWVWVVSVNFAFANVQTVLMWLPPDDGKERLGMIWEVRDGRGAFRTVKIGARSCDEKDGDDDLA